MKMDLGARLLSNALGITLVAIGGIAFAQGMGKPAPGTHLNPVPAVAKTPANSSSGRWSRRWSSKWSDRTLTQAMVMPPPAVHFPVPSAAKAQPQATSAAQNAARQRVIGWFNKYDQIRHEAQMTPDEKANAHTLMTAALTNNDGDKASGRQLLTRMVSRYAKADAQLQSLKPIPETASLQNGYERYFKTGHDYFWMYLRALDSNQALLQVPQMEQGRHELGLLDMSNKALDKKLRKEFNIAPYRWG